ncbi:ALKBH2 [Bugula neritina]|uniref:DNA oxidative demethylase ALKBH2 n=1 Tax=Bugula neritina TaxID=10212 RepID=A0A7J7IZ91_BUGNE|nr:ALKBH2 [Bugula neritina]
MAEATSYSKVESHCCCPRLSLHKHYSANGLSCCYGTVYSRKDADLILAECESSLVYAVGAEKKVKVYGKWHEIPRKQSAYGDPGMVYRFSGVSLRAKPWLPFLIEIRDRVSELCQCQFNFVLINRYKDGEDSMGEHQDDEKDLDLTAPIASLSFGRARDFVFRHESVKLKKKPPLPKTDKIKIELGHGSMLVMNPPTNNHWYHSLPARKNLLGVRVNMTFRKINTRSK